jgi:outer membrane lipoprotein SlyB
VGDSVGDIVGDSVGDIVGEFVGDIVGEFVGDSVGDIVGDIVGELVGEFVGCFFLRNSASKSLSASSAILRRTPADEAVVVATRTRLTRRILRDIVMTENGTVRKKTAATRK